MTPLRQRLRTARAALGARLGHGGGDDGLALMSTMIFLILVAGLAIVLLSVIVGQVLPSYTAQKTTRTVYAAQAGLQAGLSILRGIPAAADATGKIYGDRTKLPCSFSARVDATDDDATYSVTMQYFLLNPTGKGSTWLTSNRLPCTTGAGVAQQPLYALVTAEGAAPSIPGAAATTGNRTLAATYQFRVSNENLAGGRIYDGSRSVCYVPTSIASGSTITRANFSTCDDDDTRQAWIYDADYQIKLASTTIDGATPLCITSRPLVQGVGQSAVLSPCLAGSDPGRWNQLWSWVGGAYWKGQKQNIADGPSNLCLTPGNPAMTVSNCGGGSFAPEPATGSGAAGYSTHQIVNYKEFGRCADVTNEKIDYAFMISYPCKQDPTGTGANLLWNHKWFYTEPTGSQSVAADQQIYVLVDNNPSKKYCLQAPTGQGLDVVFKSCTNSANQRWDRVKDTGEYATSYLFIDKAGRCLAVDPTRSFGSDASTLTGVASKMTMMTCNGSDAQKWNAPPNAQDSTFGGFRELR